MGSCAGLGESVGRKSFGWYKCDVQRRVATCPLLRVLLLQEPERRDDDNGHGNESNTVK